MTLSFEAILADILFVFEEKLIIVINVVRFQLKLRRSAADLCNFHYT